MTMLEIGRIDRTIEINAPPARVWRALTDPAELSAWFKVTDRRHHRAGQRSADDVDA